MVLGNMVVVHVHLNCLLRDENISENIIRIITKCEIIFFPCKIILFGFDRW